MNPAQRWHDQCPICTEGRSVRASGLKVVFVAAVMCAATAVALAQDAAAPASPAAPAPAPAAAPLPANPLPATPTPAAAPDPAKDIQSCLQETGDYVTHGSAVTYVIGIANACDKRLRCEIYANVTGVRGTSLGHTVMILGAASSGAVAKKSYTMRVKAAGGVVQVSRDCKVI